MFSTRSQGKVYNFVHADEIWKDHVTLELQSQKRWTEQWGYLLEEYQKLQEGLLDIGSELEDGEDLEKEAEEQLKVMKKYDEIMELISPTTNEAIEVKVDQKTGVFERQTQNNARGKNDIVKILKWPREGLE